MLWRVCLLPSFLFWLPAIMSLELLHVWEWRTSSEGNEFPHDRVMYSVFIKKKGGANNKLRIVGYALIMLSSLINSGIFVYNFAKNLKK